MTAYFASGGEDQVAIETSDGPGRRLRIARQTQGLDLDRVASELRINPTMIESLEQDDYQALPGQVFIIGYIRKYARLVGLAPEPLLAAYQAGAPPPGPLRVGVAAPVEHRIGSDRLVIGLVSAGVLILLAALAFLWWETQQPGTHGQPVDPGTEQEVDASARPESTPEPRATAGPTGTDPSAGPARDEPLTAEPSLQPATLGIVPTRPKGQPPTTVSTAESSAVTGEPADSAQDAETHEVSAPTPSDAEVPAAVEEEAAELDATTGEIVMSFDGACWVDVRDSERKYMLFGEMKKGDRQVLEGKPPYSVIIGNVSAVQISVGGEAFDLSAVSNGNVARFTLDPGKGQETRAEGQRSTSSARDPIP